MRSIMQHHVHLKNAVREIQENILLLRCNVDVLKTHVHFFDTYVQPNYMYSLECSDRAEKMKSDRQKKSKKNRKGNATLCARYIRVKHFSITNLDFVNAILHIYLLHFRCSKISCNLSYFSLYFKELKQKF